MTKLQEFRQKYQGAYDDLDDQQLADALHRKFYSDMPRAEFDTKIGLTPAQAAAAPEAPQQQPTLPTEMESIRREAMTLGPGMGNLFAVRPSEEAMALEQERQRILSSGATQLGEQGIKIGEAPVEARKLSGYGLSRRQGYEAALGDGYDVDVIKTEGPYKGEIIFRKKGEEGWTTVRDPSGFQSPLDVGARVRDIQSLKGTALPEFLGAVGGAAGAAAPRVQIPLLRSGALTAAAGAGFSRYYAEIARMEEGRRLGVIPKDVSDAEISAVALNEAGWQAFGEGAGVALYGLMRAGAMRGMPDLQGLTAEDFRRGFNLAKQDVGPGGENLITVGDVLEKLNHPMAAFFKNVEDKSMRTYGSAGHMAFRERGIAKERFAGERLRSELPEGQPVDVVQLGEDIATKVAPGIEEFKGKLTPAPSLQPNVSTLAEDVVAAVKKAEKTQQAAVRQIYSQGEQGAAGVTEPLRDSADAIRDIASDQSSRLFPSLSKDQRKIVKDALKTFYREDVTPGGFAPDSDIALPDTVTLKLNEASLNQFNRAISDIRTAIRNGYRGEWKGDLSQLSDIEEALVKDRNRLLMKTGGQNAVDAFDVAEKEWKQIKDTFRRMNVASVFRVSPKTANVKNAEDVLDTLSMDYDTALQIDKYISQKERDGIRAMLQIQLADMGRAYGKAGNEIRDAVVQRAVEASDSPLRVFFSDGERKYLFNAANLQKIRRQMGVNENESMSQWIDNFYSSMNLEQADAVFKRLNKDPSLAPVADALKTMVRQKLYDDLSKEGATKSARVLDADKLQAMLAKPGAANWLNMVLDPGFATRLREVANATRTVLPDVQKLNLPERDEAAGSAVMAMFRGARTMLGPLSKESRYLTAGLRLASGEMQNRMARAILDPEYFAKLINVAQDKATGRMTAATLGAALMEDKIGDKTDKGNWVVEIEPAISRTLNRARGE
jgi:hypothetical protein